LRPSTATQGCCRRAMCSWLGLVSLGALSPRS
jgi:hypothetical protein